MENNLFTKKNILKNSSHFLSERIKYDNLLYKETNISSSLPPCRESEYFYSGVDETLIEVFNKCSDPNDPDQLLKMWLSKVEYISNNKKSPWYSLWKSSFRNNCIDKEWILNSNATSKFIKRLFNYYFKNDLYGKHHSEQNIVLSSGSVDECTWGLSEPLKDCLHFSIEKDWYGYSDSLGRFNARDAIARLESAKTGINYTIENVALTMGATSAISSITDFIFLNKLHKGDSPSICATPNYPPLVESISRRSPVELVPLSSENGFVNIDPLLDRINERTPIVMLQSVFNPNGSMVNEYDLDRLMNKVSPNTYVILDETHDFLGPKRSYKAKRDYGNLIRVFSASKKFSIPGLKAGWFIASKSLMENYYEYASTTYGGPPSILFTLVEFATRMDRWKMLGYKELDESHLSELQKDYNLNLDSLNLAFRKYLENDRKKDSELMNSKIKTTDILTNEHCKAYYPLYSINVPVSLYGFDNSYSAYREILNNTSVSVYPSILNFCFSNSVVRITSSSNPDELKNGLNKINQYLENRS